jgi:hypothetical protein
LGPTTNVGSALTAKILKSNGQTVCRLTLRHLTNKEIHCPIHQEMHRVFDETIANHLGPNATDQDFPAEDLTPDFDFYDDDHDPDPDHGDLEVTPEMGDNYLNTEIPVPQGGTLMKGCVTSWKRDKDGNAVGLANTNPILDMHEYTFTFDDGDETVLNANLIAEVMYAQCDPDGNQYVLLDLIIDRRRLDAALRPSEQKVVRPDRHTYLKCSTIGWQVCCQWKDGSTSWQNLADLKESHSVETAKYAVTKGIDLEPAFNWWVPHVLKKRDRIISLVCKRTTRYLKRTHKFGIEVPKTVKEALALDRKNDNTIWVDAIAKEMREVCIAFNIMSGGHSAPIGYQKIPCHMIFDMKMEDFQQKTRLVAGSHQTKAPATITYASVVSRETVRLALTFASLNDLEVKVGDVLNAYITAPVKEKVWTILGPEFGHDSGKSAVVVHALYGLKSASAAL